MYVLVLLEGAAQTPDAETNAAHERFIDSLIARKLVLLGGEFGVPVANADAAYVLRCGGVEAAAVAAEDPLVAARAVSPRLVEWPLRGVDPDVIDPALRV